MLTFVSASSFFCGFVTLFHVCQIVTFTKRMKMAVYFGFFLIRSVQNGSNLIKLDFLTNLKSVTIKSCHIYRKDKNGYFVFDL